MANGLVGSWRPCRLSFSFPSAHLVWNGALSTQFRMKDQELMKAICKRRQGYIRPWHEQWRRHGILFRPRVSMSSRLKPILTLCERAQKRFGEAIDDRRLWSSTLPSGEKTGAAPSYVNLDNDHWSSLDIGWAGREVRRNTGQVIALHHVGQPHRGYGSPHYLKIDVEGIDMECTRATATHQSSFHFLSASRIAVLVFSTWRSLAACG